MEKMKEANEPVAPPAYNPMYPDTYYPNPEPPLVASAPVIRQPATSGDPALFSLVGDYKNYLTGANSLCIKQKLDLVEIVFGWETNNKYSIKNGNNKLFRVCEKSNGCSRLCFGPRRGFNMTLEDTNGRCVLSLERNVNCSWFCGACLKDSIRVISGDGQILGSVVEDFNLFYPRFKLKDKDSNTILRLKGPFWTCACSCRPVKFDFVDAEGKVVGTITKEWSNCVQEWWTDFDQFTLEFPNIDPTMKALCLGALYLLEYRYYEITGRLKVSCCLGCNTFCCLMRNAH